MPSLTNRSSDVDVILSAPVPAGGVLSGQNTVAVPGTAEQVGAMAVGGPLEVKALDTNTDLVYIGNVAGDVSSANGLMLSPGDAVVFNYVANLDDLWIDTVVAGEGVAWLCLNVG